LKNKGDMLRRRVKTGKKDEELEAKVAELKNSKAALDQEFDEWMTTTPADDDEDDDEDEPPQAADRDDMPDKKDDDHEPDPNAPWAAAQEALIAACQSNIGVYEVFQVYSDVVDCLTT